MGMTIIISLKMKWNRDNKSPSQTGGVFCHSVMSDSMRPLGLYPASLLCPRGFSRQEYWSRLSCPPSGDLSDPWIEPRSPTLYVDSLPCEPPRRYWAVRAKKCWLFYLSGIQGTNSWQSEYKILHPHDWVQISALPLPTCVILVKSELFLHL